MHVCVCLCVCVSVLKRRSVHDLFMANIHENVPGNLFVEFCVLFVGI